MPSRTKRYFGFKPSFPHVLAERPKFFMSFAKPSVIAPSCQLTIPFPAYDQGSLGSCTANAVCAVAQYMGIKQGLFDWTPSRLFLYFNEREIEGTVTWDSGAYGSDGFAIVRDMGVCPESLWKYDVPRFADSPDTECYVIGQMHKAKSILGIDPNVTEITRVIFLGYLPAIGIAVFNSIEFDSVAETGDVPYPSQGEEQIGGHEVVITGYDFTTKKFTFRNSWGTGWGRDGNGTLDFRYIEDFCSEAGTIEAMSG